MIEETFTIQGFVTPRYLDESWAKSFTVTKDRIKKSDIPVKVIVESRAFEAAKLNNDMPTYQELLDNLIETRARIKQLEGEE